MSSKARLIISILLAWALGCTEGQASGVLRAVSWNIEWFPGREPNPEPANRELHLRRAQKALQGINPDLFMAQEIADWASFAALTSSVAGMEPHVLSSFQDSPAQQAGIASRLPAESAWSEVWRSAPSHPPRGFAFTALRLDDGSRLLVWTLHMKANRGDLSRAIAAREEAARQLESHILALRRVYEPLGPVRLLIAGDWNTSLDDERFRHETTLRAMTLSGLDWGWADVSFSRRVTVPSSGVFPDACFDHAFTHGLRIRSARALQSHDEISDHCPVLLEVEAENPIPAWTHRTPEEAGRQWPAITQQGVALPATPAEPVLTEGRSRPASPDALAASERASITARAGKKTAVRGIVGRIGSVDSAAITFINFEGIPRGGFVAIVRRQHLPAIEKAMGGPLPSALSGREIEVRGPIQMFGSTPQIEVERATDIHFIR